MRVAGISFYIFLHCWNSILSRSFSSSFFNISNFRFIAGAFTFIYLLLEFLSVFFYTAEIPFFRVHFLVHFLTLATFVSLLEFLHLYAYCWNFFLYFSTLLKFHSSAFISRCWNSVLPRSTTVVLDIIAAALQPQHHYSNLNSWNVQDRSYQQLDYTKINIMPVKD